MAQLVKDMNKTVVYGTPEVSGVVGSPAIAAYTSVKYVLQETWTLAAGITLITEATNSTNSDGAWTCKAAGFYIYPWNIAFKTEGFSRWWAFGYDNGTGFVYDVPLYLGSKNLGGHTVYVYEKTNVPVYTYHKAVPAVASVAYQPMTPNQISYSMAVGWDNNKGISIDPLTVDNKLEFTLSTGITGAFIGIGPYTDLSTLVAQFSYGMLVSPGGIAVYEKGIIKTILSTKPSAKVSIFKRADNTIVFFADYKGETKSYSTGQVSGDSYIHVHLYTSLDKVTAAKFIKGKFVHGGTK